MSTIRDNKALRAEIRKVGASRAKSDGIAETTILAMLLAYCMDAAKSVIDAASKRLNIKATDFDKALLGLLCSPGIGTSMVRFACQSARLIVTDKANAVVRYIVANAKQTHKGAAVFTVGRLAPLWGRIFKADGSDVIKVKGKKLMVLIPKGTEGSDADAWRDFRTVPFRTIEAAYSKKGQRPEPTPKNAAETVAHVLSAKGPLSKALEALGAKRSKRAKELHKALSDVLKRFRTDDAAEKETAKSGKAMARQAKRQNRSRKAGESRDPAAGRINNDAEKTEAAATAEPTPAE